VTGPVDIVELPRTALARIAEMDRREHVTMGYRMQDGEIVEEAVDWDIPNWRLDPKKKFTLAARLRDWGAELDRGGAFFAALDGSRLVGFAVLGNVFRQGSLQLVALFVSRDWRRGGLARRLTEIVADRARKKGATALYISSTPSESAVGFYRSLGARPTPEPDRELHEAEPEDIHFLLPL
jgi:GNAT superfamily N-acetyltransferase